MAKISGRPTLNTEIIIALSEQEAGALDALAGYGTDSFLKTFYEKMGEAYLKPYEKGLRSLFDSVRTGDASVSSFIDRTKDAKRVLEGSMKAVWVEGKNV